MAGPMQQMMRQLGGAMFGTQVGQADRRARLRGGRLAPTSACRSRRAAAALLSRRTSPRSARVSSVPADQVRLYLALREAAHHRLFAHVPWLRAHLVAAVEDYARGITVDTARHRAGRAASTSTDPEALQRGPQRRRVRAAATPPEQQAALRPARDGCSPSSRAGSTRSSTPPPAPAAGAAALRETLRRRRAAGGPAEQTFATLVGLELRPRRLREAAALWRASSPRRGSGRPRRRLVAPRPAADGRGPRRPGRLRQRLSRRRWTSPGWTTRRPRRSPTSRDRTARRRPAVADRLAGTRRRPGAAAHGVPRAPRGHPDGLSGAACRRT